MPIDTKAKRASVPGVGRPWYRTKLPNASKPVAWRIASGNAYGGNSITSTAPVVVGCVQAMAIYQPGAVAAEVYQPGAQAAQIGCQ